MTARSAVAAAVLGIAAPAAAQPPATPGELYALMDDRDWDYEPSTWIAAEDRADVRALTMQRFAGNHCCPTDLQMKAA